MRSPGAPFAEDTTMRYVLQTLSWLALAATILPSVVFLAGRLDLAQVQWIMLAAALVWFTVTPFWMERGQEHQVA